jgi:hypothetical protein
MTESNTRARAVEAAKRATGSLWNSLGISNSTSRISSWLGGGTSRMETKLQQGRENAVKGELYHGTRPDNFDAEALFCYLVGERDEDLIGGATAVCDCFEEEIGSLPIGVRERTTERFEAAGISNAPPGDDIRRAAAVDMLVDELAKTYQRAQGSEEEDEVNAEPIELPGVE